MNNDGHKKGFHGPKCWIITIVLGALAGVLLAQAPFAQVSQADPSSQHLEPGHPDAVVRIVEINHAGEETVHFPASTAQPQEHGPAAHAPQAEEHTGPEAEIPLWLIAPFAVMLLSIALMPFINERFWHHHYPDVAFFLGAMMAAFYLFGPMDWRYEHGMGYGAYHMLHVALEYYAFIALIGGLFVASGGVLIDVRTKGRPLVNTALLAFGAVFANIVGTTGASVLLIRPFMRINKGRLKPIHVVLFIFIVSNCGGALTPIGDPPLYLGYLRGVPFFWTMLHLWPMWLACVGALLAVFYAIDSRIPPADEIETVEEILLLDRDETPSRRPGAKSPPVSIRGVTAIIALALIVLAVFIDPQLSRLSGRTVHGIGPTFQIAIAALAYFLASKRIHAANEFTFAPVKEVGFLFVGIFATMTPALAYLGMNGSKLGVETPTAFYFATGVLSSFLDNAPTYLNFLQAAFGVLHLAPLDMEHIREHFLYSDYVITHAGGAVKRFHGGTMLSAISLGAVFFGAMTYIGNGPNFMVKSIAEASGLKMPSFFGYMLLSTALLLPILVLIWALFISGWLL